MAAPNFESLQGPLDAELVDLNHALTCPWQTRSANWSRPPTTPERELRGVGEQPRHAAGCFGIAATSQSVGEYTVMMLRTQSRGYAIEKTDKDVLVVA